MSSVRTIFAIDTPPLREGERVLGVVRWDEFYPEWVIGREPARRARGKRGHGGRLRKRARRAK